MRFGNTISTLPKNKNLGVGVEKRTKWHSNRLLDFDSTILACQCIHSLYLYRILNGHTPYRVSGIRFTKSVKRDVELREFEYQNC
jgi:hypothetical protein